MGWRADTAQSHTVLGSLAMGDAPVTLYAVFTRSSSGEVNLYRGKEQGDWSGTTQVTTGYAYNVSVSGEIKSSVDSGHDYRCDVTLYVNGGSIASAGTGKTVSVYKAGLGPCSNGIRVQLYVHPHSNDEGGGSCKVTVVWNEISVG